MFFYGRPRRGFPWLLAGVVLAVLVLALLFALPGGPGLSWTIAAVLCALLVVGALVFGVLAVVRPRRRR
jgi:Na+/melibiose symporter-like transporter